MVKHKQPTCVSLVLAALRERDDFMNYAMLMEATKLSLTQVSASCFSLRNYRAIGVEVLPSGEAWWYPLPEYEDTRIRIQKSRAPELKPRNRKKRRIL